MSGSAPPRYEALLDVEQEDISHTPQDQLEFQNFVLSDAEKNLVSGNISNKPASSATKPLLPTQAPKSDNFGFTAPIPGQPSTPAGLAPPKQYGFWQLEYYMQFFDVGTKDVSHRMLQSVLPFKNFFEVLNNNPDLYGPFWIATTLIFTIFITNSIAKTFSDYMSNKDIVIDFHVLPSALGTVYTYVTVIPAIVWGIAKYFGVQVGFLDCINIYGYGLSIWIPVSLVCIISHELLRWSVVLAAFGISGYFMVSNLAPYMLKSNHKSATTIATLFVLAAHIALSFIFKFYFFSVTIDLSGSTEDNTGNKTHNDTGAAASI